MIRSPAIIFGIGFLLIGILGFIPQLTPNEYLLGIFHVNAFHNVIHLVSGIIFLGVGIMSAHASRIFFRVFGIIYLFVAILGFFYNNQAIFGIMSNNIAIAWLHLVLSVIMLYLGFQVKTRGRL